MGRRRSLWIQEAIEKPGSLRTYVHREIGPRGFTEKGTIKREVIDKLAGKPGTIGKRARLARTLREIGK